MAALDWRSSAQCDAVMLAGVLKSNRVLTEITIAPGGDLEGVFLVKGELGFLAALAILEIGHDGPLGMESWGPE